MRAYSRPFTSGPYAFYLFTPPGWKTTVVALARTLMTSAKVRLVGLALTWGSRVCFVIVLPIVPHGV